MKLIETKESECGIIRIYTIDYYYLSKHNLMIYTDNPTSDMIKRTHKLMCTFDESCNMYTCTSMDSGGPIISDHDLDKVLIKYKEAFIVSLSIQSLVNVINDKKLII